MEKNSPRKDKKIRRKITLQREGWGWKKSSSLLLFLAGTLLLFPLPLWGEEEPLPTELPTIIIKGKDKSWLEIIREKRLKGMEKRGEKVKEEIKPQGELKEKESFEPLKSRLKEEREISLNSFFHLSAKIGDGETYGWGLLYGRGEKKSSLMVKFGRYSTSYYTRYEDKKGGKDRDRGKVELSLSFPEEKELFLGWEGEREKVELTRFNPSLLSKKSKVSLKGGWRIKTSETTFRIDNFFSLFSLEEEKRERGWRWGSAIELALRKTPLSLGMRIEEEKTENYSGVLQNELWILSRSIPGGKNLTGSFKIGIKGVEGEGTRITPSLISSYQVSPRANLEIKLNKKFEFPSFSGIFLENDYVKRGEELKPLDLWEGEGGMKLSSPLRVGFFILGKKGKDIVWETEDGISTPSVRRVSIGGVRLSVGRKIKENWKASLSYTYQQGEGEEGKSIPYLPLGKGELKIEGEWGGLKLSLKGEFIGERTFGKEEKLSPGWGVNLRISQNLKGLSFFGEWAYRDNWQLWKGYFLPRNKFLVGMEASLL